MPVMVEISSDGSEQGDYEVGEEDEVTINPAKRLPNEQQSLRTEEPDVPRHVAADMQFLDEQQPILDANSEGVKHEDNLVYEDNVAGIEGENHETVDVENEFEVEEAENGEDMSNAEDASEKGFSHYS